MINTNIQRSNSNHALASQAEGHGFEPRLPLTLFKVLPEKGNTFIFIPQKRILYYII